VDIVTIMLISVGLAMDAFAVSISSGATLKQRTVQGALRMGLAFGGFQMLMPTLGWLGGSALRAFIAHIDHWIAFGLLAFIGGKMIYEATRPESCRKEIDPLNFGVLLMLAVATSIDALAVGVTFAFLSVPLVVPILVIGTVTFTLSGLGVFIGNGVGCFLKGKVEALGGLVLVGIGGKILLEHLGLLESILS